MTKRLIVLLFVTLFAIAPLSACGNGQWDPSGDTGDVQDIDPWQAP